MSEGVKRPPTTSKKKMTLSEVDAKPAAPAVKIAARRIHLPVVGSFPQIISLIDVLAAQITMGTEVHIWKTMATVVIVVKTLGSV